jgi:signal transduction histidine kinase
MTGRVVVVRNITERKEAEEKIREARDHLEAANQQLQEANLRLESLSQVKDEFVSNVSHELRSPITNLKLYLELSVLKPENISSYLVTLQRETQRLEQMIEGLLALSRLDQGRTPIQISPVDLNQLLESYGQDRASLVESKGLSFSLETEQDLPLVQADPALLEQVLSILVTNAVNYSPPGGQILLCSHQERSMDTAWVGFSIKDGGPGIPADEREQLFTRFFRGQAGRTSGAPGTGLGLAIAKEIIDRFDGRIEVESQGIPGEGAVFTVWLRSDKPGSRSA